MVRGPDDSGGIWILINWQWRTISWTQQDNELRTRYIGYDDVPHTFYVLDSISTFRSPPAPHPTTYESIEHTYSNAYQEAYRVARMRGRTNVAENRPEDSTETIRYSIERIVQMVRIPTQYTIHTKIVGIMSML
jgi:hypothetical protein